MFTHVSLYVGISLGSRDFCRLRARACRRTRLSPEFPDGTFHYTRLRYLKYKVTCNILETFFEGLVAVLHMKVGVQVRVALTWF